MNYTGEECDAARAAVDAINNKTDGVFDDLLPTTLINLTVAYEGCGEKHPVTGLGDDAFEVWKALPVQPIASIGPWCSSKVKEVEASQAAASPACAHLLQRWSGQST